MDGEGDEEADPSLSGATAPTDSQGAKGGGKGAELSSGQDRDPREPKLPVLKGTGQVEYKIWERELLLICSY